MFLGSFRAPNLPPIGKKREMSVVRTRWGFRRTQVTIEEEDVLGLVDVVAALDAIGTRSTPRVAPMEELLVVDMLRQ